MLLVFVAVSVLLMIFGAVGFIFTVLHGIEFPVIQYFFYGGLLVVGLFMYAVMLHERRLEIKISKNA